MTQERTAAAGTAFAIVRVKQSPESEADDWGMGIRGRNFWAVHVTVNELIAWAYGVSPRQLEHAPEWLGSERFDVDGIPDAGVQPSSEQFRSMVQAALIDRFQLKFHASEKTLPVYVLALASGGIRISPSPDPRAKPAWGIHRGWLSVSNMTFDGVARIMQRTVFDRVVLDRTGVNERYSFVLKWRADVTQFRQMQGMEMPEETGTSDVDDIYTSAGRQLGIRIEATKASAPTMVLESVSHPAAN